MEEEYEFENDGVLIDYSKRLTENEVVLHDFTKAAAIAKILVEEDYCVMLSREEDLIILNYVETYHDGYFPRGSVYFNHCDELEINIEPED